MASEIGKLVVNRIRIGSGGLRNPVAASRRWRQMSSYEKNQDDQVHATVPDDQVHATVPDDVIKPQSENYWGPNPRTGVFGPSDQNIEYQSASSSGNSSSSPDLQTWFRPQEDVQKPPPHS